MATFLRRIGREASHNVVLQTTVPHAENFPCVYLALIFPGFEIFPYDSRVRASFYAIT